MMLKVFLNSSFVLAVAVLLDGSRVVASEGSSRSPVLVAGSIPPYVYEESGQVLGSVADVVREIARRIQRSDAVEMVPWARAQAMTLSSAPDQGRFIFPLTRTPARETHYQWVALILSDEAVLVSKKGGQPRIQKIDAAKKLHVGVLLGSPLEAELRERQFESIEPGVEEDVNAKKLGAGRLDAWLVARMVAPFTFKRTGFNPKELIYGVKVRTNDLYLAASKSVPTSEISRWKAAFEQMKTDGTYERLMEKYR